MSHLSSTTDLELTQMCKNIPGFGGVMSNNRFCTAAPSNTRKFYILNLQNENERGSHWVLIDCRRPVISYVDSYGVICTRDVHEWIANSKRKAYYSNSNLQGFSDKSCGQYCVYFADMLTTRPFKKVLQSFTSDTKRNEKIISNYIANK